MTFFLHLSPSVTNYLKQYLSRYVFKDQRNLKIAPESVLLYQFIAWNTKIM